MYDNTLVARTLRKKLKGDVLADKVSRLLYSTDASIYRIVPMLVVYPRDTEDVINVIIFAQENNIPIAPRGAGTGIAGESLTTGIVIDFTRYMKGIVEFSPENRTITVQPGLILNEVNNLVKRYNLKFGPDPSSASRATVGGSVANNATGGHSLRYGYCSDNITSAEIVLSDGRVIRHKDKEWKELEDTLYKILTAKRNIINENWPMTQRNRAGYNLKGALTDNGLDLLKILAGSEGTLGIFSEITLRLVELPSANLMLIANIDDLKLAARAVNIISAYNPSSVEMIDEYIIRLAKETYPELRDKLEDVQASLLIEFDATEDERDPKIRLKDCEAALYKEFKGHIRTQTILEEEKQREHQQIRKKAVPLLYRQHHLGKPIPVIEDLAVPIDNLPEYMEKLQKIFTRSDKIVSFYAHIGAGELHIRPYINLRDQKDRELLLSITKDVFELTWQLGGSISGEHGLGIVRSWALRKQYGPAYELMAEVKDIFDPAKILNPGKVITEETDLPLTNLKDDIYPSRKFLNNNTLNNTLKIEDSFLTVDRCNGCGECKAKEPSSRTCPLFKVLEDEFASPRAKANLIREWLAGNIKDEDLRSTVAEAVIKNCLFCGSCLRDCPSGTNTILHMPQLRSKISNIRYKLLSNNELMEKMGGLFAPFTNRLMTNTLYRRVQGLILGISPDINLPRFELSGTLKQLRRLAEQNRPERPSIKAIWFVDTFARFHKRKLAEAITKVAGKAGIELIIPPQRPSNMPAIVYGNLKTAKKIASYNIGKIKDLIDEVDYIISFEPTAVLALKEDYKYLADNYLDKIDKKTILGCKLLLGLVEDGRFELKRAKSDHDITSKTRTGRFAYHIPCHLRRLFAEEVALKLLYILIERANVDIDIEKLPDGCCGLAGTFGMQNENRDIAQKIVRPIKDAIEKGRFTGTISECSACRIQLEDISGLPSYHPIEIIAELL